ncbi:hypothetical protein CPC08DRAFT_768031 [Agrocybe pediades]|nr:hypothetical protein CPC08DRAFT_768031 [Agrocybe pediades]
MFTVPRRTLNYPGTPFELPFPLCQPGEDEQEERPAEHDFIDLKGVAAHGFEVFLHAQRTYAPAPKYAVGGYEYWLGVLKLASLWNIKELRRKALKKIGPVIRDDPLKKVFVGRKYLVPAWVKDGYVALCCTRDLEPQQLAERPINELALDWKTIAMIFHVWGHISHSVQPDDLDCRFCGNPFTLDNWQFGAICQECDATVFLDDREEQVKFVEGLVSRHFRQELEELEELARRGDV